LGQGCANDVAKEVVKLKAANVEGLILDIRYNGGGSLGEGLNLAGIFIDEGPLCMMQARGEKPVVMKDMNRGTIYDGPLVVMVNGQSASASEILASTLQDYNRALIVGSPTFGKSTGQIILPLDTVLRTPGGRQSAHKNRVWICQSNH
jgi:carboxyl-terminal processing protease